MALSPGSRLGPYEVIAPLGAGGMGEVYRARDTKLGRDVAVKILPDLFAADRDRLARFHREAQILASLNHPNIGAIHGLEESDGVRALVLELVEGPTLADRIARGAIPPDEAWPIARQIAAALEAAHERGIIHRDLKPANIKLRPDDVVKVLDFGLAKAVVDDASSDPPESPTITAVGTRAGVIIGTAAYMSPEQARGRPTDKRTDVWAFGCVLYEMLSGKRAFDRETVSDTLAAVLGSEPDWTALGFAVPAAVRLLLRGCLEKDRKRRIANISTALFVMRAPAMAGPATGVTATPVRTRAARAWRVVAAVVAITLAGVGGGTGVWLKMRSGPRHVTRFTITPSETLTLTGGSVMPAGVGVAIAPDGTHIVYNGSKGLFAQALDQLEPVRLTDSGGNGGNFCFNPDGHWVGFLEEMVLKKTALTGGPITPLGGFPMGIPQGITWGENGTIIVAGDASETGLIRFPEAGGEATVLTHPDRERGEVDHLWPEFLPGGQAVLFTITRQGGASNAQLAVLDLRTLAYKTLVPGSRARYARSGHLVYGAQGTLMAIAFDLDRLAVLGESVLVEPQSRTISRRSPNFDIASNGTLVYEAGGLQAAARTLVWVDREGHQEPTQAPARQYVYPRLSPDGARVALDISGENRGIWIFDFAHKSPEPLTHGPTKDRFPVWLDNRRVLWASDRAGEDSVFSQAADGTGKPERLTQDTPALEPMSVTPDGRVMLREGRMPEGYDLSLLDLSGNHAAIQSLLHLPSFSVSDGEVSPNRQWLAYQSNESNGHDVYVRPFPDVNSRRWKVSPDGGVQPLWAPDGRELFYLAPTGTLMSVKVERGPTWTEASPTPMFDRVLMFAGAGNSEDVGRQYDIHPDGKRFLMIKLADAPDQATAPRSLVVVLNWFDELKRLVPGR